MLAARIIEFTIPSGDDGKKFVLTNRLDLIRSTLAHSRYECFADLALANVYSCRDFHPQQPFLLVSSHIDSIYDDYYAIKQDGELQGTFDNSACNAILVESMLDGRLPEQVLVSFTGDEENDSKGVDQTIRALKKQEILKNLEMVIVLDLTEEYYGSCDFTVENYCVARKRRRTHLRFDGRKDMKKYLTTMIDSPVFVKDAGADEAWQYAEHDLNCFTLCLPCRLLGDDMHDDIGVAIGLSSLSEYLGVLERLAHSIVKDLDQRTRRMYRRADTSD